MKSIVCLILACCAVAAYGASVPRIVGGRDAEEGKYPYQVSLRIYGVHTCGASIVNDRYVLTAAHCVMDLMDNEVRYVKVHAGTNSRAATGEVYAAEKIIQHPGFSPMKAVDDIALIRVAKPIVFNEKVQPIGLARSNFAVAGVPAVFTGWGTLSVEGTVPEKLQEIDLLVESQEKCQASHPEVTDGQICTFTKAGEGACYGDSGGPLVANGLQIGVVSYGKPCAVGVPDVFTRVFHFEKWINENMSL